MFGKTCHKDKTANFYSELATQIYNNLIQKVCKGLIVKSKQPLKLHKLI